MAPQFLIRAMQPNDLGQVHQMLLDSTGGETRITREQLGRDLFETLAPSDEKMENLGQIMNHKSIEIDLDLAKSNKPLCRVYVAAPRQGNRLLGYLLSSYLYTPWSPRITVLRDIYTRPEFRRQGGYG